MTQSELIAEISNNANVAGKDVRSMLNGLADVALEAMQHGHPIDLPGIGKLRIADRAARTVRNPNTGEPIEVPAKRVVTFKAAKSLRDAVR